MKNILAVLLSICLSSFAGELIHHVDFQDELLSEFRYSGYSRMQLTNCESVGLPGEPLLPVRVITLVVPSGAKNVSLSAVASDVVTSTASGVIQPGAVPRPFSAVASTAEIIHEDPSIYELNEFWPALPVQNLRTGNKSGYTIVSFFVYPYRYNPVSRELEFSGSVDVTVTWTDGFSQTVSPGQRESAGEQLSGWIDNPRDIQQYSPLSSGFDAVDYLVISASDYSDSFTSFVAFKNSQGITTELVDIADVLSSSSGYDDAEKLRNYIINRYSADGIQHVLLAGDQTVIPVRMVALSCEGYTDNVPVDLYFSDLDGTWDASGDHNYGQTNDDLDLYADVSVGRALFDTTDEAAIFVERAMMYESTPPVGDWQTTAMLCGAGLFTGYTGAKVCDSIAVNLPTGWIVNKAYETAKSSDGFTTPIDIINGGTNWVHYAGHGNTGGIYWQGSPTSMMTNSIAQGLTNGDKAGIHHSIACMPGSFHAGECCAEALLHNGDGGASSVMFNTSYGWEGNLPEMGVSEWMCVYLTEEVYENGNSLIGEAFATSKDRRVPLWSGGYDREFYCILDWHGFHDPTLIPLNGSTGIEDTAHGLIEPHVISLSVPCPNPASAGASVSFIADYTGSAGKVSVFDIQGRLVWTQVLEAPGTVLWNIRGNSNSTRVQPGIYFVRLEAGSAVAVRKLIVTI
ncbi:MAG: T9SS type A sorting domain-containing protein [Candidatus Sabulitectum sp.]|nr:T9SS type A sorting domain-containing protein [Candidatus Sabulitectum sp.]